jgi:malonyl-CoA O-methyltransferase
VLPRTVHVLEPQDAYDRIAENYPPSAHNALMRIEEQAVTELLPGAAERSVLDLGCGSGRYLLHFAELQPARIAGIDFSGRMLDEARRHLAAARKSAHLVRAEAVHLPFAGESFDVVVAGLVLGHVEHLTTAVGEIARVLRPGGVAVWSDIHPSGTLSGWVRELRDRTGARLVVRQFVHRLDDHRSACAVHGLEIDAVREPVIDFEHPERGRPAVLVVRARKPR